MENSRLSVSDTIGRRCSVRDHEGLETVRQLRKTTVKKIYASLDHFFTACGDSFLRNRRVAFVPTLIIFAGLLIIRFAVGPVSGVLAASADVATTEEDRPVTVRVLANDKDPDDGRLKIRNVVGASNGTAVVNDDGTVTYTPNPNFCGMDEFSYTAFNGKGQSATTSVRVTVAGVNDAPIIVSKPVLSARTGVEYKYDVNGADPDVGDRLTYSLVDGPQGMSIDATTGVISWTPDESQIGKHKVTVRVSDSGGNVPDEQSFEIVAEYAGPSGKTILNVERDLGHSDVINLLGPGGVSEVRESNDERWETEAGAYGCFEFSDATLPTGAKIKSVVIFIEHYEDKGFPAGKLIWKVGTGWPHNGVEWASIEAPVRETARWEGQDSWDITSFANTLSALNSLQLRVENDSRANPKRIFIDHAYVVVTWERQ